MKNILYWESKLEIALSTYNFELMIKSVKNGAFPDDMILHRAINRDRVDIVDFFLFSPDIPHHCNLNYDAPVFGKNPAFTYACSTGAMSVLEYLINDTKVCDTFDFKDIAQSGLTWACNGGYIEAVEYLLSCEKTRAYCSLDYKDFAPIKSALIRNRIEFMNDLILNHKDFDLILNMSLSLPEIQDHFGEAIEARKLKEQLDNELSSSSQVKLKNCKI